jgi:lipid II:glycine glycyltransferase (peptidoglycan interpeptide bridge formation enzyme)
MLEQVLKDTVNDGVTYLELRSTRSERWKTTKTTISEEFVLHTLDLRPPLETIYEGMHRNTIQRKILRAERERLNFESGNTETLLNVFYPLQVMTRKRHDWPPQPIQWFRNLRQAMGESLQISIARKDRRPIAALLTLNCRNTVIYKHGASDARYHCFGAVPFLFWKVIQQSKYRSCDTLDLGRSDLENEGLITFKRRLGATASDLAYVRYGKSRARFRTPRGLRPPVRRLFQCLPDPLFVAAGKMLYRHVG